MKEKTERKNCEKIFLNEKEKGKIFINNLKSLFQFFGKGLTRGIKSVIIIFTKTF